LTAAGGATIVLDMPGWRRVTQAAPGLPLTAIGMISGYWSVSGALLCTGTLIGRHAVVTAAVSDGSEQQGWHCSRGLGGGAGGLADQAANWARLVGACHGGRCPGLQPCVWRQTSSDACLRPVCTA
jgi:hypothetical protein